MEVEAYAKINLTLEVLGRRPDGYHQVSTILQTIGLADRLCFSPSQRLQLQCSSPGLAGMDNLVLKAAEALRQATGCDKGVKVHLEKQTPLGIGLGGGSSDAAATLKALNAFWQLGLKSHQLQAIAASLGSDVPFFLRGGTAFGQGRGEVIKDLPPMPMRWMVLLCPSPEATSANSASPKTSRLYSMVGPEHYTDGSHTRRAAEAIQTGRFSHELLFNTFTELAPAAFQGFEAGKREFLESGAAHVHLSGTGPALYSFVSLKEEGEAILKSLKKKGLKAYCVSTI